MKKTTPPSTASTTVLFAFRQFHNNITQFPYVLFFVFAQVYTTEVLCPLPLPHGARLVQHLWFGHAACTESNNLLPGSGSECCSNICCICKFPTWRSRHRKRKGSTQTLPQLCAPATEFDFCCWACVRSTCTSNSLVTRNQR